MLATQGYLGFTVSIFFILGLIAAAYSSADSALTALTTSFCIDFLSIEDREKSKQKNIRKAVHLGMSFTLFVVIMIFSLLNDESVISSLFKAAGYTYGPLLGMFAFGLMNPHPIKDRYVPIISIISPILCFVLSQNSESWLNGYKFGFE